MNNGFYEFSRGKQQVTSSVFPYTGSALITGSLGVTGSVDILGTLNNGTRTEATGEFSHAEGDRARAVGFASRADGFQTVT